MSPQARSGCHLCGAESLQEISGFRDLFRVTSDVKPWSRGAQLHWCGQCGAAQALINEQWHTDCRQIYEQYSIYEISRGAEQLVFEHPHGVAAARSKRLVALLKELLPLPLNGEYLDIGCGNGAMLKAFAEEYPDWKLTGSDVQCRSRDVVENIVGKGRFIHGDLDGVSGTFDAISLVHVLEHIPWPADFLRSLHDRLNSEGYLIIQVPDCAVNSYMYTVADHATHFTFPVLCNLIKSCGFEPKMALRAVFGKELTVVSQPVSSPADFGPSHEIPTYDSVKNQIQSLAGQITRAKQIAANVPQDGSFGLFGTSISATWMFLELGGNVRFFVDEDVNRLGRTHLGLPVIAPSQVPTGGEVFLCLTNPVAANVAERLKQFPTTWHLPESILSEG